MTVTFAAFVQDSEPPLTDGAAGALRSMRAVLPGSGDAGAHVEAFSAPSTVRNWTTVSPSPVIGATAPAGASPRCVPPSVDVRYS